MLVCLAALRLSLADESLSFDYQFYIAFIDEVRSYSVDDFVSNIIEFFPYYPWGKFGRFEFGFAVLVYLFPSAIGSGAVYAIIACASLFWKLQIMRRSRVPSAVIALFFIFFITLFESNALRAGVALAFVMAGVFNLATGEGRGRRWLGVFLLLVACTFHVSALAMVGLVAIGVLAAMLKISRIKLLIGLSIGLIIPAKLMTIAQLFGGKIAEYVYIAERYDLYSGASGINVSSVSAILLFVFFATEIGRDSAASDGNSIERYSFGARTGLVLSYGAANLILFSGILSVIGDRIWQLILPTVICLMCIIYTASSWPQSVFGIWARVAKNPGRHGGIVATWSPVIIFTIVGTYIVVNLLFRYPQSNFFDFIFDRIELIPPNPL